MRKKDEIADPASCLNKAKDDEILFVVMGRDPAFAKTVRAWIQARVEMNLNSPDDAQAMSARDYVATVNREHAAEHAAKLKKAKNTKRRATLIVKDSRDSWEEVYIEGEKGSFLRGENPKDWARGLVERYNISLRKGERRRELVKVVVDTVVIEVPDPEEGD